MRYKHMNLRTAIEDEAVAVHLDAFQLPMPTKGFEPHNFIAGATPRQRLHTSEEGIISISKRNKKVN